MSRHIPRSLLRSSKAPLHISRAPQTRRCLSTAPPAQKSRSWKSSAVRWGLAAGAIYYYNTSPFFANNPILLEPLLPDSPTDDASLPTLESVAQSRKQNIPSSSPSPTFVPPPDPSPQSSPRSVTPLDPSATEEEASSQGAFNEETGEINWDCPCLGGMADGPCGEKFKTAFSCFVFSKDEPKGMDCIEHFKGMQECFREYPDIYGGELGEDDEVEGEGETGASAGLTQQQPTREQVEAELEKGKIRESDGGMGQNVEATAALAATKPALIEGQGETTPVTQRDTSKSRLGENEGEKTARAQDAKAQVDKDHAAPLSETDDLVPKASHDATPASTGK